RGRGPCRDGRRHRGPPRPRDDRRRPRRGRAVAGGRSGARGAARRGPARRAPGGAPVRRPRAGRAAARGAGPTDRCATVAPPLGPLPAELATLDEVEVFVADALDPALSAATTALDGLPAPLGDRWRALRARHLPALGAALTALRARVGARARADADAVLRDLAP